MGWNGKDYNEDVVMPAVRASMKRIYLQVCDEPVEDHVLENIIDIFDEALSLSDILFDSREYRRAYDQDLEDAAADYWGSRIDQACERGREQHV